MKRASKLFSVEDKKQVAEAVAEAERKTSGELVPVVATSSGRYERAEDIVGLCVALVTVAIVWLLFQKTVMETGDWIKHHRLTMGLLPVLVLILAGFATGVGLSVRFPWLKRLFIHEKEMLATVDRAARESFQRLRVSQTEAQTGVLIYVSLFERMVRVLGDDTVANKFTDEDWKSVCRLVTDGLANGRAVDGFIHAIDTTGHLLEKHFPIRSDDKNELSNQLYLID